MEFNIRALILSLSITSFPSHNSYGKQAPTTLSGMRSPSCSFAFFLHKKLHYYFTIKHLSYLFLWSKKPWRQYFIKAYMHATGNVIFLMPIYGKIAVLAVIQNNYVVALDVVFNAELLFEMMLFHHVLFYCT